jgi:ferredoxin-NADP reductase
MSEAPRVSRPTAIDVLAAAVARVTPRALHPRIDAVRLDLRQMVRSLTVEKTHPFSSTSEPFEVPPSLDEISVLDALLPKPLAERVDAVRRDVRAMTRPARNEKSPVVVPIRAQPAAAVVPIVAPAAAAAAVPLVDEPSRAVHPRTVRVLEARRETADATTFVLEDPSGAALSFHPGQFVTVIVTVDGEAHRRAYSISSALSELPRFAITVKRVRGGVVSNHLNDRVREGETLEILGPSGAFCLGETSAERLFLFAGGSGITPVYAILRDVLANDDRARVTLVYANRSKDAVIFREALDELVRDNPERLTLLSVLEQSDEYAQLTGRLDAESCAAVCEALEVATDARCFVCGPEPMMDAVRATLLARGVDRANIHEERFSSPQRRTHEAPASRGGHALEIRYGKSSKKLTTRPDQTILEAGLEAGIDMPFSCTMGGCGACKLSLVSGTVDVVEPNCLLESEREAGAILACVGCTTSDAVVEIPE